MLSNITLPIEDGGDQFLRIDTRSDSRIIGREIAFSI